MIAATLLPVEICINPFSVCLVFFANASSRSCGSKVQLSFATSASQGEAPQWLIALALAINVKDGNITRSFGCTPMVVNAKCNPVVPELDATAYVAPTASFIISSSLVTALVIGWNSYRQHLRRASSLESEVEKRTRELGQAQRLLRLIVDTTPASLVLLDKNFLVDL